MFLWQILITHSITGIQMGAITNFWHPLSIYLSSKVGHVPEAWPISKFHPFGSSELDRAGQLSQVGPMNSGSGFLLELMRKGLSLPTEFAKLMSTSHHELGSFLKKYKQNKRKQSQEMEHDILLENIFWVSGSSHVYLLDFSVILISKFPHISFLQFVKAMFLSPIESFHRGP